MTPSATVERPSHAVEEQMRRWSARTLAVLWAAQLAPWAFVAPTQVWASSTAAAIVIGSYVAYAGWTGAVFLRAVRGRPFDLRLVTAAVLVMAVCVVVVGLACRPGTVVSWQNWTAAPATGVAMLAQVFGGWRRGAAAVTVLGGLYALTALRDLPVAPGNTVTLLGNVLQLAAFTVTVGLVWALLGSTARRADAAAAEALDAREAGARMAERVRQYEMLHTNVLTTLTLIARGDGAVTPALRERCAREARYLRAVVHAAVEPEPAGLGPALAEVVLAQGALGLDIHHRADALPADLPAPVAEAVTQAVKEALNNVVKHAGVGEAWVVATGEDDGLVVAVTDRGRGFDPAAVPRGVGLTRTVGTQVEDVGGAVAVRSCPGDGTTVEITWTR